MTVPHLVVEGDDLGLAFGFNTGLLAAHQRGCLTSVSLRANGPALADAVNRVLPQAPLLGRGAHICLNEGPAVFLRGRHLSFIRDGRFRHTGIAGFLHLFAFAGRQPVRQLFRDEIEAQLACLQRHTALDHLNSHMHVHMIPWLFDLCADACARHGIPFIRTARETAVLPTLRWRCPSLAHALHYAHIRYRSRRACRRLPAAVRTNDAFIGLLHSGTMRAAPVMAQLRVLRAAKHPPRIIELLAHPALPDSRDRNIDFEPYERREITSRRREDELAMLCSPELAGCCAQLSLAPTTYRTLAERV